MAPYTLRHRLIDLADHFVGQAEGLGLREDQVDEHDRKSEQLFQMIALLTGKLDAAERTLELYKRQFGASLHQCGDPDA